MMFGYMPRDSVGSLAPKSECPAGRLTLPPARARENAWQRRGNQLYRAASTKAVAALGVKPDGRDAAGRPGVLPSESDSSPRRRRERPELSDRDSARHRSP